MWRPRYFVGSGGLVPSFPWGSTIPFVEETGRRSRVALDVLVARSDLIGVGEGRTRLARGAGLDEGKNFNAPGASAIKAPRT